MVLAPELGQALQALARLLADLRLPYAIGGAIAMSLHGYVRATRDIDVLVLVPALRAQEFADALNRAGFSMHDAADQPVPVEVARMMQATRELGFFRVWWQEVRVEVFSPRVPLQDSALQRRVCVSVGGFDLWLTTVEDLILLKMIFDRDKDSVDVRRLIAASREQWIPPISGSGRRARSRRRSAQSWKRCCAAVER